MASGLLAVWLLAADLRVRVAVLQSLTVPFVFPQISNHPDPESSLSKTFFCLEEGPGLL